MFKKSFIIFAVFIIFSASVLPQKKDYKIVLLPKEQGVATDLVYKMIIDRKGFLWLGTMFGLVKYDGKNYHIYNNDPFDSTTISFDDVIDIFEDDEGFIWTSTWSNGINRFNPQNEKFDRFLFNPKDSLSISSNTATHITQDESGNIWIAAQNGVLNKYLKDKKSFQKFEIPKSLLRKTNGAPEITTYFSSKGNDLIICYAGEIIKFDAAKKSFEQYFSAPEAEFFKGLFVNLLYCDSKNNLWIGTYGDLFKYNSKNKFTKIDFSGSKKFPSNYSNTIKEIKEDYGGNLWIGTPIGLNKLNEDGKTFSFFTNGTNKDRINIDYEVNNIVVDRGGVIWVSSYRRGLYRIFEDENIFETVSITTNEPQSQNYTIKNIIEDNNGNILAGSFGRGLLKLNKQQNTFEEITTGIFKFGNINALALENNKLWIGSNAGLHFYDFSSKEFHTPKLKVENLNSFKEVAVSSLLIDSLKRLWVGTASGGVFLIDKKRTEAKFIDLQKAGSKNVSFQEHFTTNINMDKDGNVWIGTFGGLYKYSTDKNLIEHFKNDPLNNKSISNNYIFSFHQDKKGIVWIGTANGLNKFGGQKNEFTKYFKKDGLPSTVINGITEDIKGNIWLSTNKGICKFDLPKNEFYNFDLTDGISANSAFHNAYFKGRDNKIYFGARGGLIIINPETAVDSIYNVPVLINSFVFGNNSESRTKIFNPINDIEIKYDENFININFIALDYRYPERINYEYRLEGFEEEWNFSGNDNSAIYNNLPPGKYTFLLRAANENGTRSKQTAELSFVVLPPFWNTWWFITIFMLLLGAAVYAAYKSVLKIKINRALEIEHIKINEREKLKRKTAVDFHDEVGYRLTKISILSELIKRKIPKSLSSIEEQLINITEISNEIYIGTKDFIWSIDPKNDSVYELFVRLKDFGDEFFNGTQIDFRTDGNNDKLKNYFLNSDWKRHLTMLFKEAMNNSSKHSYANQVTLHVCASENKINIELEDNGRGFSENNFNSGNGLKNMKSRAEKIGGLLKVDTQINKGTKIIFTGELPKVN